MRIIWEGNEKYKGPSNEIIQGVMMKILQYEHIY